LHILALVALELDHLAHLTIGDDGAIAGCNCQYEESFDARTSLTELLLDHLEDLLLIELLREALNSGQSLTTIALCVLPLAILPRSGDIDGYCLR
jgi:hypothetical protein